MHPAPLRAAENTTRAGLSHAAELRPGQLQRRPDAEDDRRHDRQPTQSVGCGAEADGVTDLEIEPIREAALDGETCR